MQSLPVQLARARPLATAFGAIDPRLLAGVWAGASALGLVGDVAGRMLAMGC